MRSRLKALGVEGVSARTFHSAALGQLRWLAPGRVGEILPEQGAARCAGSPTACPGPTATERPPTSPRRSSGPRTGASRRVATSSSLDGHEPPLPADLMLRVYEAYERDKQDAGLIDFEDLLELAIRLFEEDEQAAMLLRERFRTFTVDEYQDVNLLQQSLLDLWLGERDELCAVGDDYQAIYGFTGATPDYLLALPERFARRRCGDSGVELPLDAAGARAGKPARSPARRRDQVAPGRPIASGVEPECRVARRTPTRRRSSWSSRSGACAEQNVAFEQMAILVRSNARAADFEEALAGGGDSLSGLLAARARGGALPAAAGGFAPRARAGERSAPHRSGAGLGRDAAEAPRRQGDDAAGRPRPARSPGQGAGRRRAGRHGLSSPRSVAASIRAPPAEVVHLLTYHRAKGLEFTAVFLPRLEEKEIPCKLSLERAEELAEERRLLYVGLTRAKRPALPELDREGSPQPLPRSSSGLVEASRWRSRIEASRVRPASSRCAPGVAAAPRATAYRPSPSSRTAPWGRSRPAAPARWPSWPRCAESGRKSSSATVKRCWRCCRRLTAAQPAQPRAPARRRVRPPAPVATG